MHEKTKPLIESMDAGVSWYRRQIMEVEVVAQHLRALGFNPPIERWTSVMPLRGEKEERTASLRIQQKLHGDESLKDPLVVALVEALEQLGHVTTEDVATKEDGPLRIFRVPAGTVRFTDEDFDRALDVEYRVSVAGSRWCQMVTRIECFAPTPEAADAPAA